MHTRAREEGDGRGEPGALDDEAATVHVRAVLGHGARRPWPPTGTVSERSAKPAISGRPFAMAACTAGSFSDAAWLACVSQTSVIQMASSLFGSSAIT